MTNSVISPLQGFRDKTGVLRAGGLVTFYVNKTTTKATIYSDEALTVAQSNPYTLSAAGEIDGDVRYEGVLTLQITNADGSDLDTIDDVITTNATATLRTDLASTDATKGKSLVQGSFIDNVNTVLSASTYTVVAADRGSLIEQTSVQSTTVTLIVAATAGEGFTVAFRNNSATGIWTIVGDSGEAINEGTQVILAVGEWTILVSDGVSSWRSLISNEPYLKAVTAITANTVVDAGDRGLIFDAINTITVTTPAAATVTEGFSFTVRNAGTGVLTIDGNASETVNGVASITLNERQWVTVVSDGTNWSAVGGTTSTASTSVTNINVVQVVNVQDGTSASGSASFPIDNTIPQISEGKEYMTLAITPNNSANLLKIEVTGFLATTGGGAIIMALFQGSTANALAASYNSDVVGMSHIVFWMTAGTTSEITFRVRAGSNGTTVYFNGGSGSSFPLFNGVMASTISITEYTQ